LIVPFFDNAAIYARFLSGDLPQVDLSSTLNLTPDFRVGLAEDRRSTPIGPAASLEIDSATENQNQRLFGV
jgi:hypothetical protein